MLPLVNAELRQLAAAKFARESPGQTLQPTALVHEAWLRLTGDGDARFENRSHFLGAATEAMRRVLIERARRRLAAKRGGGLEPSPIGGLDLASPAVQDEELLAVGEALEKLAAVEPEKAELVKLRYFVGMSFEESATAPGIAVPTARKWWAYACAWFQVEMTAGQGLPPVPRN